MTEALVEIEDEDGDRLVLRAPEPGEPDDVVAVAQSWSVDERGDREVYLTRKDASRLRDALDRLIEEAPE